MPPVHGPQCGILSYRRNPEGPRVLDLGCGDGERAITLAGRRFNRVTGLDPARSLIDQAIQRAARRNIDVSFVCGDPCATPFDSRTFDEVMLLGGHFGHGPTAKFDVDLLREARRLLKPGGRLHLRFMDGDWLRRHYRSEIIEKLSAGFIHHYGTLSRDGHHIRTDIVSSDEGSGFVCHETRHTWLYTRRDIADLLHRLGFTAINYDALSEDRQAKRYAASVPSHTVHCCADPARAQLRTLS